MMKKRRATSEEVAKFFDKMPRSAGSLEARVKAVAKYFGIRSETVIRHLRFWWPGEKFLAEFDLNEGGGRRKWDMPAEEIVKALNQNKTVAKTAKALKTTPITLTKALERKGIERIWVQKLRGN
jgi:DNA invertase Pin-like site-specific DNA recombinase